MVDCSYLSGTIRIILPLSKNTVIYEQMNKTNKTHLYGQSRDRVAAHMSILVISVIQLRLYCER